MKQDGGVWNKKLNSFLVDSLGFKLCISGPCIYILRKEEKVIILGLHVDDMILAQNDVSLFHEVAAKMGETFEITDLGTHSRLL